MKSVLGLLLVLAMSTALWAQGGEGAGQCAFNVTKEDHTCNGWTNCEFVTFTAPCDGEYRLGCEIVCNAEGEPSYCAFTATVWRISDSQNMGTCHTFGQENCEQTGADYIVTLEEDVQYRLVVCFEACYNRTCTDTHNCYGLGRVYRSA